MAKSAKNVRISAPEIHAFESLLSFLEDVFLLDVLELLLDKCRFSSSFCVNVNYILNCKYEEELSIYRRSCIARIHDDLNHVFYFGIFNHYASQLFLLSIFFFTSWFGMSFYHVSLGSIRIRKFHLAYLACVGKFLIFLEY